jgi:O-antigen/teichoic acid export membrane protein
VGARVAALIALGVATVLVARTGGAGAVGLLALLRVLPGLVGVAVSCGLPSATPYFLSSRDDATVRTTLAWLCVGGAGLAALCWVVASPVLHAAFFGDVGLDLVIGCAAAVFTQQFVAVGKSLLQGRDDLRGANGAIVAEEAAFLPAYLMLTPLLAGPALLVVALVVADVAVAAGIVVRLARRGFFAGRGRVDLALAREISLYGLRGQVGGVLLLLNLRFDFALLDAIAGTAVLGVYSVASKYAELLRLPGLAVSYVLYPRFTRQGSDVAAARTRALMPRATWLTVLAGLPLALAAWPLLPALYGQEFRPAVVPAWILIGGLAGEGVAGLVTAYLYACRRPGLNSAAMGAGVITTVALDLALIPRFGAIGAAVASTAAYLLTSGVLIGMFLWLQRRGSLQSQTQPVSPAAVPAAGAASGTVMSPDLS